MRLWVKIFIWFSLAMGFVAAMLALSIYLTSPDFPAPRSNRPGLGRWRRFTGEVVSRLARQAAEEYQRGGALGARRFLEKNEQDQGIVASLYKTDGTLVAGPPLEPADLDLVRQARRRRYQFREKGSTWLVARRAPPNESGDELVLVGWFPRPGTGFDVWQLLLRLGVVLATGAVLCYGLARYLMSPAAKLQLAVRKLASGQLDTRVGSAMGNRRDELADLARDFDAMAERIQHLVESQNRLIRDISHELRSPLTRLNLALELAQRRAGPEAVAAIERIAAESEKMNQLIGQLLSLSRMETSEQELELRPVDLKQLLENLVADGAFEASRRGCRVHLDCPYEPMVEGSGELLRSALDNIVRNAVRYSPDGGVVTIRVEPSPEASRVRVLVEDQGPGVPEENLADIFRPFFRVGEARDRESGGTGLGLAIAARIIQLHRGRIWARNLEPGLQVIVELPLSGSADPTGSALPQT